MSRRWSAAALGVALAALAGLAGCSGADGDERGIAGNDGLITMGFAQVGAESGWRAANTVSIQESARQAGIELTFSDAQQKQENQIAAIRGFIADEVDVIAFSPVVKSGWDTVLREAQDAGIPVILTDRAIDTRDPTFYRTMIGSDFMMEGKKAAAWLVEEYAGRRGPVNIVELQGTTGSAPASDRKDGFSEVIAAADAKFTLIGSEPGDFTRAGGRQVMTAFLESLPDIDVVYAHNDDMGLGAIEAIEAAGLEPGRDIRIITVDAVRDGMRALADGKINFIVECSPLLGPQLMDLAKKVVAGETVPARVVTDETTFTRQQAQAVLPARKY